MSTTSGSEQAREANPWENYTHVSRTPATAGTARGHGRSAAKDVIDVASLPPSTATPQQTPSSTYADRMARADGCPECVVNYALPVALRDEPGGFRAEYRCESCGRTWDTGWRDE